jgi:predicted lipoprotein with Yx(FWY)xxD motif
MHYITKFGLGAVAVVLLGACGSDSKSTTTTPTTKAATTTVAAAAGPTTTVKSSTAPTTTVKSSSATTTAAAGTAASGTVALATTTLGKVVVDSEGRTLYLYTKDAQNKPSTCVDTCATTFPPETATGTPTAGTGLDTAKVTVIKRTDGSEQLAYNGWPLYRYEKDAKSGDTTGQGVGGVWYVVDATGNAIK